MSITTNFLKAVALCSPIVLAGCDEPKKVRDPMAGQPSSVVPHLETIMSAVSPNDFLGKPILISLSDGKTAVMIPTLRYVQADKPKDLCLDYTYWDGSTRKRSAGTWTYCRPKQVASATGSDFSHLTA